MWIIHAVLWYSPRTAGWRGTSCIWHNTGTHEPSSASQTLGATQTTSPGKTQRTSHRQTHAYPEASLPAGRRPQLRRSAPFDLWHLNPGSRRRPPRPGGDPDGPPGWILTLCCPMRGSAGPRIRGSHTSASSDEDRVEHMFHTHTYTRCNLTHKSKVAICKRQTQTHSFFSRSLLCNSFSLCFLFVFSLFTLFLSCMRESKACAFNFPRSRSIALFHCSASAWFALLHVPLFSLHALAFLQCYY